MTLICCVSLSYAQQSIQFTQYIFNSLSVNPAYAGYKEQWMGQMNLRSQWTGWSGAPKIGALSVDGIVDVMNKRHGVGFQVIGDQLGAQSALSAYANYALRLQLDDEDKHRLSLGIAGGVTQYGLDGNKLNPVDFDDPVLPNGMISTWQPDVRLGVYYANPRWYLGASFQDLFASSTNANDYRFNENSLENLYRNISLYVMGGAVFDVSEGLLLRPSVLIKDNFRGPTSMDVNAMLIFSQKFWIGAGYRTRTQIFDRDYSDYSSNRLSTVNSLQAITQLHVSDKLRIGYSYDFSLNRISNAQNGSHEVGIGMLFGKPRPKSSEPKYF